MQQLKAKRITQSQAAEQLGLTVRQIKRLWRAYRTGGAKALVSQQRGRPSNHQLDPKVKQKAQALIQASELTLRLLENCSAHEGGDG